jgi:thiamine kinase-like enzyme
MADHTNYRLALILPQSRQLIAAQVDETYVLPQISIPLWERPAQQLTRLIEEQWHIQSVVLDIVSDDYPESPFAIVEVRTSLWDLSTEDLTTVDLDKISDESLRLNERKVLQSILMGGDSGRGPFSRIGWIEEVQAWVQQITEGCGATLTAETLHLSAGGHFCLIRLTTSSGAGYWLKATGEPNTREFAITTFLAEVCPQYLPRLIASREDWNAWLTEEHGSSLRDSESLEDFRRAVHNMAELQKRFIGESDALFAACCGDHRNEILHSHIAELIAYLDEAMVLQTSVKAPQLSSFRLKVIGTALNHTCSLQQELGIPDSLMHGDINPGNILFDGNRYVFTDWCEANVGNPFITLEQLCVHAVRRSTQPELWERALRAEYKACWTDLLTERQVDRALQLAPLLSILSSLHGSGDWLDSPKRYDPQRLSYARSLARHIDRVLQTPDLRAALCH